MLFDRFEMDLERFELRRDGDVLNVEPQVFDLLAFLVQEPGRLVTRDELVVAVWHGRIVSEATIDARIAAARRAIDDDGKTQRFIKTVPRRGFRFMVDVETAGPASKAETRADANGPSQVDERAFSEPVVAILPFRNLSLNSDDSAFAEGISEDITTALSRFHALRVTSRMSSFQYRDTNSPPREIANALGADFLMSGTVRRAADRIRIGVELYEEQGNHQIWSESFDRVDTDIFAVQDEISQKVASRITGQVEFAETRRMRLKASKGLTAYEALLEGLDLHKSGNISPQTARLAVTAFSRAIDADPTFARAYAWRACSYSRTWGFPVEQEDFDAVSEDVFKALELDPSEAEAHRIAGAVLRASHDFDMATHHIEQSLSLNPSDAHIAIKAAEHYAFVGEPDRARQLVQNAMALNPIFPHWYWEVLALVHYVEGSYADAIAVLDRSANPTFAGLAYKAAAEVALDQTEEARRTICLLRDKFPEISLATYQRNGRRFAFRDEDLQTDFLVSLQRSGLT